MSIVIADNLWYNDLVNEFKKETKEQTTHDYIHFHSNAYVKWLENKIKLLNEDVYRLEIKLKNEKIIHPFKHNLDKAQKEKLQEWLNKKNLDDYTGAIGGRFTEITTSTSIGIVYKIKDNLDGTEIDLSDYDNW